MSQRMPDYDALLARENEATERIAKARYEIQMQKSRGIHCPSAIDHILAGDS